MGDGSANDAPAAVLEIAVDSTPLLPGKGLPPLLLFPNTYRFFEQSSSRR